MKNYRAKEISWLSFNERLLQEAERKEVPLIERIKFLGIYSNNLDEFFRVRVAILKRLAKLGKDTELYGGKPSDILQTIHRLVIHQSRYFYTIYEKILKDLEKEDIFLINEMQLNGEQGGYVKAYFEKKIRPLLMPVIISEERGLPDLKDEAIYLAVHLKKKNHKKIVAALIEVPTEAINRFILLPRTNHKQYIIILDDVIRYELRDIFYMYDYDEIGAYTIKLTRDAELEIDDEVSENYVKKISLGLEKRKEAHPVRFLHDKEMPEELLNLLLRKLKFSKDDVVIRGGRYHNFKDFVDFPKIGGEHLVYKVFEPIRHPHIKKSIPFIQLLKQRDVLFHFPYHPFDHFIDILREASIDPFVREIKITIYRVAKYSNVVNALINAARNGKKVTAVLELQARFDEKANIKWANRLKEEGVKVMYGVPGLKVHSKLVYISRKEKRKELSYAAVGTGNFNEESATVFSDHLLFTSNPEIVKEVGNIFLFFEKNFRIPRFKHLLVAPFYLRNKIVRLINQEIQNAQTGKKAFIYLKLNNLVDLRMIHYLYKAKASGVDVRLNVRGMFSMTPDFHPEHEPIPAIALIDRFLEHSRIFIFGNQGQPKVWLSSADLMGRNLDRRVEVACPVYDDDLKKELLKMFNLQWKDNGSARILDNELSNKLKKRKGRTIKAQQAFYSYLKGQD